MGHKIFVSYKYADDQVKNLDGQSNSTARDYVDKLEEYFGSSSHIYKGEKDGEDLSQLEEDTIWSKLRDRIFDSTMTIIFISPGMKVAGEVEKDQWIPWEVSFSLRTTTRKRQNGDTYTSNPNAMLAVILPDANGAYSYFLEKKNCCSSDCTLYHTGVTFDTSVRTCSTATPPRNVYAIADRPYGLESTLILPALNGVALFRRRKRISTQLIIAKRKLTTTPSMSI